MKQAAFSCQATGNWSRRRVWLAPSAFLFNRINAPRFWKLSVTLFRRKVLTEKLSKARFDLFLAVIEPAAAACRGGQIAAESGMSPIGSAASDAHAGNKPSVLAIVPESRQLFGSFTTAFLSLKVNESLAAYINFVCLQFSKECLSLPAPPVRRGEQMATMLRISIPRRNYRCFFSCLWH